MFTSQESPMEQQHFYMPGHCTNNDWIWREFENLLQYTYFCFSIHIQSNTSALLCDFWQGYSMLIMLNWNVSGRCLLCDNQTMCTVIRDNHSATFSSKNCTHALLMLTRYTIIQYIIYSFIRIFLLQKVASVLHMGLIFEI